MDFVSGIVTKKRTFGALSFLEILTSSRKITQAVLEGRELGERLKGIREGSVLRLKGEYKKAENSRKYDEELSVSELEVIALNYEDKRVHPILANLQPSEIFTQKNGRSWDNQIYRLPSEKMRLLLEAKSCVLDKLRSFLREESFIEVHSPKLVDSCVESLTKSFEVDFYGEKRHLTISNVLYHHMLLMEGFDSIYEISPIFRQQDYGSRYQLSEFWVLDVSESWKKREDMMARLESLVRLATSSLRENFERDFQRFDISLPRIPETIERKDYEEILSIMGIKKEEYGTHIPFKIIREFKRRKMPMVWVLNAPQDKKPFFIKRERGYCRTAELWTDRTPILASGGERVCDYRETLKNINELGLDPKNFQDYLSILKFGSSPSYSIGMGIERLLQYLTSQPIFYLTPFPRFPKAKLFKQ